MYSDSALNEMRLSYPYLRQDSNFLFHNKEVIKKNNLAISWYMDHKSR